MNVYDILDHLLGQQNSMNKRFRIGITACALGVIVVEHRRKKMENQLDILKKEIEELKAVKGE